MARVANRREASARSFIVLVGALACGGPGGVGDDDGGSSDDTGGPVDLSSPDFIEPASGEVSIATTRIDDLVLEVRADVGVTRLWIDGVSVGTLTGNSRLGVLESESLALRLRGAMLSGIHTLQLQTPDAVETEASDTVTVTVQAPPDAVLAFEPGEVIAQGDALVVGSGDAGAVMGLVNDAAGTSSLHAWPVFEERWDLTRTVELPLEGHVPRGHDARVTVASVNAATGDRVRAAWVMGQPGTAIAATELAWGESASAAEIGFRLGPWIEGREWVAIERPLLAGPRVLAEIQAPVDTESPRPGDRVIASVTYAELAARDPQIVPTGAIDLDLAGVVIDTLAPDAPAIGLRRAASEPVVLEVEASSGNLALKASAVDPADGRWHDVVGPLVTTRGAFDSRMVVGLASDRMAIVVARIDDGGKAPPVVSRIVLPEGRPASANLAATVVDGRVIVLVPRGTDGLVAVEVSAAEASPRVFETTCDAVAAVPMVSAASSDVDALAPAAVDVACLAARMLSIGRLVVSPG